MKKKTKLFISHDASDIEWIIALRAHLEREGFEVWSDISSLQFGDDILTKINKAIAESDVIIVVLREGPFSPNVLTEAGIALGQGKTIIPITSALGRRSPFESLQNVVTDDPNIAAKMIERRLTNPRD
jgi:hypothetical protein